MPQLRKNFRNLWISSSYQKISGIELLLEKVEPNNYNMLEKISLSFLK